MVESWWDFCVSSRFCQVARASSCMVVVVNHMPCDKVELDILSESVAV